MGNLFSKLLPEGWVRPEEIQEEPQSEPVVKQTQAQTRTINLSEKQPVNPPVYQTSTHQSVIPNVSQGSSGFTALSTVPDPEYLKFIEDYFEKENLPGIEYFELRTAVREMISGGTPVDVAFKTIYIAYKATGLTVPKLIETNQFYQGRFGTLKTDFISEANGTIAAKQTEFNKNVGALNHSQENLNKEEEKLRARLQQIEADRKANNEEISKLQNDFTGVTSAQELRKAKMSIAIDYVVGIIVEDEKAIQMYLK